MADKGKSEVFTSDFPTWLVLVNDFRKIDWINEFPFPTISQKQLTDLLTNEFAPTHFS